VSFVTTVTCARNIKGDYPSFLYIIGDFASEHVARVSDNGDRMRGSIKAELNALAKANPLGRCLASGVPAMDCGWENLVSDRSKQCFASDTISICIKSKWIVGILSIHNLSVKLVVEIAAIHITEQGENITQPELSTLYIFLISEKNSCCGTHNQNYPNFKSSSTRLKLNSSAIGSFTKPRRISIGSSHVYKITHSGSLCNSIVAGTFRRPTIWPFRFSDQTKVQNEKVL
jgi:hypothetical protein